MGTTQLEKIPFLNKARKAGSDLQQTAFKHSDMQELHWEGAKIK